MYGLALRQQMNLVNSGAVSYSYLQGGFWEGSSLRSVMEFAYGGMRDLIASAYPGYVFTLMFYIGCVVLVVVHRRKPLPYIIAAPVAVLVGASLLRLFPLTGGPQDLFLTPLLILVAATAIDYLISIDAKRLTVAVLMTLMVWRAIPVLAAYYPTDGGSSVGKIIQRVAASAAPGDPVYLCTGDDPAIRYYVVARFPIPDNPIVEGIRGPGPRDHIDQVDDMLEQYGRAWMVMFPPCGEMTPLLDHIAKEWKVELIERRYPDTELYYVH
ncbi:MAG: hypothetical protein A2Z17_02825 [Gammaproteobacteria bacterium RBG_16_66_13]|nr:MAG: hypothetical protein A2Z17_02825 [Gammaproteobacteria bacterium RBG_16_66_13]